MGKSSFSTSGKAWLWSCIGAHPPQEETLVPLQPPVQDLSQLRHILSCLLQGWFRLGGTEETLSFCPPPVSSFRSPFSLFGILDSFQGGMDVAVPEVQRAISQRSEFRMIVPDWQKESSHLRQ